MQDKLLTTLSALLLVLGLSLIGYVVYQSILRQKYSKQLGATSCVSGIYTKVMDDELMKGIIDKGEPYRVLKGYYSCNKVERNDIVWFRVSPSITPVPRRVYAIPGDHFEIVRELPGRWNVKINGEWIMVNGSRLFIESDNTPPLKTYEISRKGILEEGEYIIFANVSPGVSDSGQLGIVRANAFDGRVVISPSL